MAGCEWRLFRFLLPHSVFSYFLSSGAQVLCKMIGFCPLIYFSLEHRLHIWTETFTFQRGPKRANVSQRLFFFFHLINAPHLNHNKKTCLMDNDLLRWSTEVRVWRSVGGCSCGLTGAYCASRVSAAFRFLSSELIGWKNRKLAFLHTEGSEAGGPWVSAVLSELSVSTKAPLPSNQQ